jgi:hypothetical protein
MSREDALTLESTNQAADHPMENSLPNARLLLDALAVSPERLKAAGKAAVPLPVLRALLSAAVASQPFNEEFYLSTYSDVSAAHKAGQIEDLRSHFIASGFLEGRLGAKPDVDEGFYRKTYPDVAVAISKGEVASGYEHFVTAGAWEGRSPNAASQRSMKYWQDVFAKARS